MSVYIIDKCERFVSQRAGCGKAASPDSVRGVRPQGVRLLDQTLLVRLPLAYFMSIQPNASLTKIGLAAPISTMVGVVLNIGFYVYLNRAEQKNAKERC